ncbi:DUF2218 domain-containing protein [Gymnodinialimonas ceratoperidinii]|uniref:DUF2218 domain-containing protein n=1 Tax=Gymnodinialimonas ceratoperidinii TaxID=2856823 RepID=A0A8F6TVJ8_9RHOB|nr:DUF2218 domain-containing protein [Gymnodinialimonas ceratoperidinii]QXT39485.1 DUF2218 domain-containing protein [Gymnodinialimonas ceratoperidinii]
MARQTGIFRTDHGKRYMKQLCKHFSHKVEVSVEDNIGRAALPPGPTLMLAEDGALRVEITAETVEGLETARHIIDVHLKTFAFREAFTAMDWSEPEGVASLDGVA